MSDREKFEREGLPRQERGEPLGDDLAGTEQEQATYGRLKQAIGDASPADRDDGWQARVFEEIDHHERRPHRHRYTIALAAATVLLALFFMTTNKELPPPSLSTSVSEGEGPIRRGVPLHPGSRLTLDARTGGMQHVQLRVYRDDVELLLQCSDQPPCTLAGDRLSAELVLEQRGEYRSLLLLHDAPLPGASGALDEDVAAATAAGVQLEIAAPVSVR